MCAKPVKKLIRFYENARFKEESNDVSIFTMIKYIAINAFRFCNEPGC